MSDLSWLNPTPHAIAVYASRPLSPVAAQHSLPSGRYSLLGPDFHRLDRTSLRLAHSFDHLVGAGEQRGRHREAERLRRDQIDDKFKPRRLLDWYIAGLRPAQNFIHVICRAPEPFRVTWSIGHETPAADKVAGAEDRWKSRAKRKRKDAHEVGDHELIDRNVKRIRLGLDRLEGWTEILHPPDLEWRDFDADRAIRGLGLAHLQHGLRITHIEDT